MKSALLFVILLSWTEVVLGNALTGLTKLQDDFWAWRMRNNPTSSTYNGMCKYNDLMESFNMTTFTTRREDTVTFTQRLEAIPRNGLDQHGKVNYDILNDTLQTFLDGNLWAEYGALSPISFLGGIHLFGGPYFSNGKSRGDFENYIDRLYAVQSQVDEIIELGRRAFDLNRTLHNVSLVRVPEQIDNKIFDNPEKSPYFEIFKDILVNDSHVKNETIQRDIQSRGRLAVQAYMDAFKTLKYFIVNEYMPRTREGWGVDSWDPTHNYYKACLKWHLSFEMSPEDVHKLGLQEVERITESMHNVTKKLNFSGSVSEFFKSLENDSRFYSNDSNEILKYYNDTVFQRINPKLETLFKNIPDVPLVIEAAAYDGLGGGYSSASETNPGVFTINLFRPLEVPKFEAMALSLHEANPGHHMQHSYSMKANLPEFRRDPMLSFYNVPNWFPFYSAYQEGWGLYSEYLGEEMGLYEDEYELMGRYSYDILRASRLVVDTGLHYYGERAIEYLQNYTALAAGSAANEIDRYITWPGQACAYKIGEIKLRQLREKAEKELGDKFNIRDYHLHVLENGAMPMRVLETLIDNWIQGVKDQPSPTTITPGPGINGTPVWRATGHVVIMWLLNVLLLRYLF